MAMVTILWSHTVTMVTILRPHTVTLVARVHLVTLVARVHLVTLVFVGEPNLTLNVVVQHSEYSHCFDSIVPQNMAEGLWNVLIPLHVCRT